MKAKVCLSLLVAVLVSCASTVFAAGEDAFVKKMPDQQTRRSTRTYSVQPNAARMTTVRSSHYFRHYFPERQFRANEKIPGLYLR